MVWTRELISGRSSPNIGWSPLHFAVLRKATMIAHYLISRGADVNLTTKYARTHRIRTHTARAHTTHHTRRGNN